MNDRDTSSAFSEQLKRMQSITGARTQMELADMLGIRQSSVSEATKRGKIPSDWLLTLMRSMHVNPEWILTGRGLRFISMPAFVYDDTNSIREKAEFSEVLRQVPSRMLADELLRRIAISETNKYSN